MVNSVFFWYPNLVGYLRILSTLLSFYYILTTPIMSMIFYSIGQGLDCVDGPVARYFHQTSKFGAMLDMLTDRMSTAALIMVLSLLYPLYWYYFIGLVVLDTISHWFQMYAKVSSGKVTHKGSENRLLNFYYTFPYALLVFCVGNELFYIMLYMRHFPSHYPTWIPLIEMTMKVSFPIFLWKQFMNIIQFIDASREIADMDRPKEVSVPSHHSNGNGNVATKDEKGKESSVVTKSSSSSRKRSMSRK